jgi:hypothetical protein
MKKIIFLLFFNLTTTLSYGQTPWLTTQMNQLRAGETSRPNWSWLEQEENRRQLLKELKPYYTDSLPAIRSRAVEITLKVGQMSQELAIKQQVVERMLAICTDESPQVVGRASNLTTFEAGDFSEKARQELLKVVESRPKYYASPLVKLLGFVGPEGSREVLNNWLYSGERLSGRLKMDIRLALARLGDEQAMNYLLQKAGKIPLGDALIYDVLPELLYTRSPQAVDFAVSILNSDQKACYPANPDATDKILCGYRIMEMLAPLIEDFPLQAGPSGDLLTEDYPKALKQCRSWLAQHRGTYKIRKDFY